MLHKLGTFSLPSLMSRGCRKSRFANARTIGFATRAGFSESQTLSRGHGRPLPAMNWIQALSGLLWCGLLAGCADLPAPPPESTRAELGKVVITPALFPPQSNIRLFAKGTAAGAARGAAAGATAGLAGAGTFAAAGALEAVIAPYLAVVMVPAMATGSAYLGAQSAVSGQDAAALEAAVEHNLAALEVPDMLARSIAQAARLDAGRDITMFPSAGPTTPQAAPDYRSLGKSGADNVLEVAATKVGFTGGKRLRFYLVARVRLLHVADGSQRYEREFVYQSDTYPARLWAKDRASLFQAELTRAYTSLAQSVVDQVFLLPRLPLASKAAQTGEPGLTDLLGGRDACGLAWVSPPREYRPSIGDTDQSNWNGFPVVADRQPTLSWESFPREADRRADHDGSLPGIRNVRYDLRVWENRDEAPPALVYERRDLSSPSHGVEEPLSPGTRYFWSARARFELAGTVHATQWGCFRTPGYLTYAGDKVKPEQSPVAVLGPLLAGSAPRDVCTLDFIPTANYYRFRTP